MNRAAEINHLIGIKGSLDEVYVAVSTVEGLKEFIETGNGRPYPHDLQTTHG